MRGYIAVSRNREHWVFREGTVLTQVHPTIEKTLQELISVIKRNDEKFFQRLQELYEEEYLDYHSSVEDFILDSWDWLLEEEMDIHKVGVALEEW